MGDLISALAINALSIIMQPSTIQRIIRNADKSDEHIQVLGNQVC